MRSHISLLDFSVCNNTITIEYWFPKSEKGAIEYWFPKREKGTNVVHVAHVTQDVGLLQLLEILNQTSY